MRFVSWSIAAGLLASASPLLAGLATAYQGSTHYYVENDALKIAFLRTTGSLDGITHKQSGINLQSDNALARQSTWVLQLQSSTANPVFVSNTQTTTFAATIANSPSDASLTMTWQGLNPPGAPKMPQVTVIARVSVRVGSNLSFWAFEMSGPGTNSTLSIDYPLIKGLGPIGQSADDDELLLPSYEGRLYHNPTATEPSVGGLYPGGGASMQLIAYLDQAAGIFLASDDSQGNTKNIYWYQDGGPAFDFSLNIVSMLSEPSDSIKLPYDMIVGPAQGDWYSAADAYRTLAVQQPWTQQSRTRQVPAWVQDMALTQSGWGYSYSTLPNQSYATFVKDLGQQATFGVPSVGQLIGWEKYGAFAYGDYFPPEEGWSSFDAMVQSLRPSKLWLIPSALFLNTNTDLYRSGTLNSSAMLDIKGNLQTTTSAANIGGEWVFMDISTDPWAQQVVDTYATLAAHGADMFQFDSSMVFGPVACYNPAHSHPPGNSGNWQTLAWISLINRVASAISAANPNAALSAESPAEVYLPYFSLYTSGQDGFEKNLPGTPNVDHVPLDQYVYHDSIFFSDLIFNPVLDGSYFRLEVARDLTWGQIPNSFMEEDHFVLDSASHAYLQSEITARTTYAKKFLVDGIMLPAPQLTVPLTTVKWIDGSNNQAVSGQYPSVMESAWRAAAGSVGIMMANITTSSLTFSLPVQYSHLDLPAGAAYTVQSTAGSAATTLDSNLAKDSTYSITLGPAQMMLVTLTPKAPQPQITSSGVVLHATTSNTVAPGSLFDIYGANFAASPTVAASGAPVLPSVLGTTQVLINGIPAPLLYAGPTQIVAQIPGAVLPGTADVVVVNAGAASAKARVTIQQAAPAILTYGTNRAIVENQDSSLNSSTSPAQAGSYATAYLIGSGPVSPALNDGVPAAASSLSWETLNTTATVGGMPAQVLYAGMAPGFVGLVQIDFQVPDLPAGDYPIQVSIGAAQSNAPAMTVGQ